jgi:hypothetical protein
MVPSSFLTTSSLPPLELPENCNYIGLFLTLDCNLHCSYCINRFGHLAHGGRHLGLDAWLDGINRLVTRADLPITLQGGEPTLHPDFFALVNGIRPGLPLDLLTNLEFDLARFMAEISPYRFKRDAPYASIRVSYHPEIMKIESLAVRVLTLLAAGYHVGIWGVLHPLWTDDVLRARDYSHNLGIDFRTKEFLGLHDGAMYGAYSYAGACEGGDPTAVQCRTTELIIGPGGDVYRCHSDLYAGRQPVGHILDRELIIDDSFRRCDNFGHCNPCDVKLKNNRFQEYGHTSVEIVKSPV